MKIGVCISRASILIFCALFILGLIYGTEVVTYIFEALNWIKFIAAENTLFFVLLFLAVYVAMLSVGLPGGALLALLAGFFFDFFTGFFVVILGASLSASLVWMIVRVAGINLAIDSVKKHRFRFFQLVGKAPFQSLLILRLIPILPFYFVNFLSAASGVRYSVYLGSLCLGLVPSTLAFVIIGEGVASQMAVRDLSLIEMLFHPLIVYPSLVLIVLSLAAIYWRGFLVQDRQA